MRIAVIDPWDFTPPYNRELCAGLASIGHDVTLIGQESETSNAHEEPATGGFATLGLFTPPAMQLPRIIKLMAKGLRHVQGLFRLHRALRRLKPDVIHFQWLPLPLIDALFVPLMRRLAPVVLTVHDSNPYNGAGPLFLRLGNMLAVRSCDRWIVHNEISEQHLLARGLPADRIDRVMHGLLGPVADPSPNKTVRDDGYLHVLQFGKLKDYKGADVLLKALGSLNEEQRARCRVAIVGRPYLDTAPLFRLVEQHHLQTCVELRFDFVSDADMAALFDRADFLVFPYRGIDTSGVLMAAIARGIPVVASDIGCFAEMLVDGEEGRLVQPDDPEALAGALIDLIEDPVKVQAMRSRMVALRDRIPSWARIAETTAQVYEHAQRSPSSTPLGAPT